MDELIREAVLHWIAVVFYIMASIAFAISTIFGKPRAYRWAVGFSIAGLLPHSAAILMRWSEAGHGPYMMRYEVLSSNAWIFIVMYLLFSARTPRIRFAGMIVLPYSFLTMTYGLFSNPEIKLLPPALRTIWLILHVIFYKLAVGAILISLASAIFYLMKEKKGDKGFLARLPSLDILDHFNYRFAGFGFTFWSIGIMAGSIWANQSWGRYWGWDSIETWSLVTWLFYGFYLHMHRFFGWKGKRGAWLVIGCFILSFVTAFVVPFVVSSIHQSYFTG